MSPRPPSLAWLLVVPILGGLAAHALSAGRACWSWPYVATLILTGYLAGYVQALRAERAPWGGP